MNFRMTLAALTAPVFLSACVGTDAATSAPGTLGTADPSGAFVAEVYDKACIAPRPDYAATPAALTALGFAQADTGTFYDGRHNLSVKLIDGPNQQCSVVWGVKSNPSAHLSAFREALMAREPLDLSTASFKRAGELNGAQYFNTRTSAK